MDKFWKNALSHDPTSRVSFEAAKKRSAQSAKAGQNLPFVNIEQQNYAKFQTQGQTKK